MGIGENDKKPLSQRTVTRTREAENDRRKRRKMEAQTDGEAKTVDSNGQRRTDG